MCKTILMLLVAFTSGARGATKPNIIAIILADDMGYCDCSVN